MVVRGRNNRLAPTKTGQIQTLAS